MPFLFFDDFSFHRKYSVETTHGQNMRCKIKITFEELVREMVDSDLKNIKDKIY